MYNDYVTYKNWKFLRTHREKDGGIIFGRWRMREIKNIQNEWVNYVYTVDMYIHACVYAISLLKTYDFIV